jgi:phenylacetate-CoA ligase
MSRRVKRAALNDKSKLPRRLRHGLGAHPIRHGVVRDVLETLDVMNQEHVNGLVGIPTQVLAPARFGEGLRLKSALLTTDHVPNAIVRAVEHAWGCLVYNHYGMTEMGLGGGECQARRGYHLREADMIFEIVNPATGEPVAEGETGEAVFTTLTRRGMPLIRSRTGRPMAIDIGRPGRGTLFCYKCVGLCCDHFAGGRTGLSATGS